MNITIYVVFGATGEYSDRTEWMVQAFMKEELAQALVLNATTRANEVEVCRNSGAEYEDQYDESSMWDPKFRMYYNGTRYYYKPVELKQ